MVQDELTYRRAASAAMIGLSGPVALGAGHRDPGSVCSKPGRAGGRRILLRRTANLGSLCGCYITNIALNARKHSMRNGWARPICSGGPCSTSTLMICVWHASVGIPLPLGIARCGLIQGIIFARCRGMLLDRGYQWRSLIVWGTR